MPTLRDIRRRITGVANTSKITQAMKMVSASKLRRAQEAIQSARPYVLKLSDMLGNLVESVGEEYTHPLVQKHTSVNNIAVICIASDRGLCGSFNANLIRYTTNQIENEILKENPSAKITVFPVGKKACSFYKKYKYPVSKEYPGIFAKLKFEEAKSIVSEVSSRYIEQDFDQVYIFFNAFKNVITQVPSQIMLLPIEKTEQATDHKKINIDYIFEPDEKAILDVLLPKHLDIQLWRTLLESNAAEQAARMMAMDNATTNARELITHLELVFNKARQAAITKEMLEIVSGAEALKKA
ncbi:MAG: ATP synthase F1 subunit gamma [FCB group bacterium]|jgi:F-type H+-transporting ATPase subunit gamma